MIGPVYVYSLAYCGMGEVVRERRDGRLEVRTPSGRRILARPDSVRPMEREFSAPPPVDAPACTERPGLEAVPKRPPVREPAYLAWLRGQTCARCGEPAPSEASHHPARGHGAMSSKAPDTRAIPLCSRCHRRHHQDPLDREWVEDEIAKHLRRWVREMGR